MEHCDHAEAGGIYTVPVSAADPWWQLKMFLWVCRILEVYNSSIVLNWAQQVSLRNRLYFSTLPITKHCAKKQRKRERQRLRKRWFWSCSVGRGSVEKVCDARPMAMTVILLLQDLDSGSKPKHPFPSLHSTLSNSSLTLLIHSLCFLLFLLFQACCAASVPNGKHASIITNPPLCRMKINNCFSPFLSPFAVIDAKWSVASEGLLAKSEGLLHLFLNYYANLFPLLGIYTLQWAGLQTEPCLIKQIVELRGSVDLSCWTINCLCICRTNFFLI